MLGYSPDMLRHACGFALSDQGAGTQLIQNYLGHHDIGPPSFTRLQIRQGLKGFGDERPVFYSLIQKEAGTHV